MNEQLVLKCNNIIVTHDQDLGLIELIDEEAAQSFILTCKQWNELVDYIIKYRPRV